MSVFLQFGDMVLHTGIENSHDNIVPSKFADISKYLNETISKYLNETVDLQAVYCNSTYTLNSLGPNFWKTGRRYLARPTAGWTLQHCPSCDRYEQTLYVGTEDTGYTNMSCRFAVDIYLCPQGHELRRQQSPEQAQVSVPA